MNQAHYEQVVQHPYRLMIFDSMDVGWPGLWDSSPRNFVAVPESAFLYYSPGIIQQFNAVIGGKFHQLVDLNDTDVDVDKLTDTFNTVMSDTAAEVLGKGCSKKQSWITDEILALCDERRKLKKHMKETHSVADE